MPDINIPYVLTVTRDDGMEVIQARSEDVQSLVAVVRWLGDSDRTIYRVYKTELVLWGTGAERVPDGPAN